jgi:hypothetical protein
VKQARVSGRSEAAEKGAAASRTRKPVEGHSDGPIGDLSFLDGLLDGAAAGIPLERCASVLCDARFRGPANASRKVQMVSQLQQKLGNAYVQRLLSSAAAEAKSVQLQPKELGVPKGPPKTTKDPKEIAGKVIEAVMKTDTGKKVAGKLKKAATSEEGIAILGTLAVPALAVMFAEKMEVPQFAVNLVPKIAKIEPGKGMELSFQPIYKGKFGEKPKEWGGMVNFTLRW